MVHETPSPPRAHRRQIVRGVAWTAPLVAVGVGAPAFAVSTSGLKFDTFNLFPADYQAGIARSMESNVQVQYLFAAGPPTLTSVTLQVAFPASRVDGGAATIVTGSGWAFQGPALSVGSTWLYTFVWTGSLAPSASTSTLDFKVARSPVLPGLVTITGSAIATATTPATGSASYTFRP